MTVPGPHPKFASGELSRRVPVRAARAPYQSDPDMPRDEAPPLLVETLDDYTDVAPVGRVVPITRARRESPPLTTPDSAALAEDFLRWRRRHGLGRRSKCP